MGPTIQSLLDGLKRGDFSHCMIESTGKGHKFTFYSTEGQVIFKPQAWISHHDVQTSIEEIMEAKKARMVNDL